jgi:hypothetical protein
MKQQLKMTTVLLEVRTLLQDCVITPAASHPYQHPACALASLLLLLMLLLLQAE